MAYLSVFSLCLIVLCCLSFIRIVCCLYITTLLHFICIRFFKPLFTFSLSLSLSLSVSLPLYLSLP